MVFLKRQPQLMEVVRALDPPAGLPGRLDCGQQQTYKRADDRNDDQELDKGETR
jgi:hypothetical protein